MIMPPVPAKASGRAPCPTGTAGETINRTNQHATLRTTAANSRTSTGLETDEKPTGSLATALHTNQIMMGTVSRASTQPAGFACHERSIRPRTNQANAVVIPHVGHSLPVVLKNEQDGQPELRVRAEAPRVRLQLPRQAQQPENPSRGRRKHAPDRPTQRIKRTALLVHGWPPAQKDVQRDRARRQGPWKGMRTLTECLKPDKMNLVQFCQWSVVSGQWLAGGRLYTQRGPD